ncbi:ABC-2 type transport system ATP-binding protein [Clostridium saccharoperbutylacetonicum]|uniref:ABC-type multidrug transport system, ATPase component n=1 Tax=Clostridium saccharoperbutylacetonicum N1-4(HMT) TaxID=931276 RepID=M1MW57_9CLOT|nr:MULTISPECIES: ABC transporter ATP-binding protein [Clostridium]AGF58836.1 ABC-type multidrug transport system, ATPase component [Clostridium saccharoperbutylacetonicum N1-4(HMT)]NRT60380.1 ABC-2 type transport system ATP-binding protein [Clostridium saccharoperbutylacetonicum]NSB23693.1 ABC-2 type transport system ATP-binding protein [Clostridium saccharoperbutylacetonicum]NSB43064.1 ABC-2 type transport system ATP-binding protein [Clostridium saccharoperbutylacetonicum]
MEESKISTMSSPICIKIEHVNKSFGKKQVLFDISIDIPYSQILGLLGPSGSGKSTLVKMIAGIDNATNGSVFLLDTKMPQLSVMNKIGYMAQSDALYDELTAEENIKFFSSMYKIGKSKQKQRIAEVMELVNLSEHLKKQVKNYSGGMKRRLSLAIALVHEPPVLILDEPTVGIDPVLRKSIWAELYKLKENGTTIIITTHVMDEVEKCDNLGMIRDGKLIAVGSPNEIKQASNSSTIEDAFLYYGGASN